MRSWGSKLARAEIMFTNTHFWARSWHQDFLSPSSHASSYSVNHITVLYLMRYRQDQCHTFSMCLMSLPNGTAGTDFPCTSLPLVTAWRCDMNSQSLGHRIQGDRCPRLIWRVFCLWCSPTAQPQSTLFSGGLEKCVSGLSIRRHCLSSKALLLACLFVSMGTITHCNLVTKKPKAMGGV